MNRLIWLKIFLFLFSVPLFAGQDFASGGARPRIGQISHSVVLGTLNVGEPGEAGAPDLGRVCFLFSCSHTRFTWFI